MAEVGPNIWNNNKPKAYKTRLGQNNILEDEFCGPLISARRNCLPGCWAQHGKKKFSMQAYMLMVPFKTTGAQYNVAVMSMWTLRSLPLYYYIC